MSRKAHGKMIRRVIVLTLTLARGFRVHSTSNLGRSRDVETPVLVEQLRLRARSSDAASFLWKNIAVLLLVRQPSTHAFNVRESWVRRPLSSKLRHGSIQNSRSRDVQNFLPLNLDDAPTVDSLDDTLSRIRPTVFQGFAAAAKNFAELWAKLIFGCVLSGAAMTAGDCVAFADEALPVTSVTTDEGSPVALEVIKLLKRYYLDRTFNGVDLNKVKADLIRRGPLTDEEALKFSEDLVNKLGDRYSRILDPQASAGLSKFDVTGVGVNLVIDDQGVAKIGQVPAKDSAAGRAGIKYGDVIATINGKSTTGMASFDTLEAIQEPGVFVNLRVRGNDGKGAEREVSLKKAFKVDNPVSYRLIASGPEGKSTGFIKLKTFNSQAKRSVGAALEDLKKQGAAQIILDLRGNSGGALEPATGIAGFFMNRPLVLYVTDAASSMQAVYSREKVILPDVPLQIWIDQGTASSAEVLTAGLRDNCRATVVGGRSFGKGVIQGVFGLTDGGAIVETVAKYMTPTKDEINQIGIAPDSERILLSNVPFAGDFLIDKDVQATSFNIKRAKACKAVEAVSENEKNCVKKGEKAEGSVGVKVVKYCDEEPASASVAPSADAKAAPAA